MADRNFANLWAARARLAYVHAQLDEAVWTPFGQWSASSVFGVVPASFGTITYPQSTQSSLNISGLDTLHPFLQFNIGGTIPLVTFGRLDAAARGGEANVRASEWDMERARSSMHLDLRRAYFGVALARDAADFVDGALAQLVSAESVLGEKIARGAPNVAEVDRLRLQAYEGEIRAQALQAPKGDAYGLAALRLLTGLETVDVVDAPLKRPDVPLAAIVQYLEAARLLRPDVNSARATVAARRGSVDYARARLLPDVGLALAANYSIATGAPPQQNVWAQDQNFFFYSAAIGMQWSLDLLPQEARIQQAESSLEEARALERLALSTAMVEVERAYADAVEAKTREEAWDHAEHDTKHWMAIVKDQIDLGTADDGALLEPLRAYGNARVRHLYALLDYTMTLSALAQASGWEGAAPASL